MWAARGRIIAEDLHIIKNAIKYPDSLGHKLIGSGLHPDDVSDKFGKVRNELDVYAEKSSIVIKELTKILTEIRYNSFIFLKAHLRDKTVTLWVLGTPCSGKSLLVYLLVITAAIALSWIYSVSAVICDSPFTSTVWSDDVDQVTGAFMANALLTTTTALSFASYVCSLVMPLIVGRQKACWIENKTELVLYIARQSTIAYSAKRFSEWATAIFIFSIIYSLYRNRREREFRRTVLHILIKLIPGRRTISCRRGRESHSYSLAN